MLKLYKNIRLILGKDQLMQLYLLLVLVIFLALLEMGAIGLIAPFLSMLMSPEILQDNIILSRLYDFLGITDKKKFVVYLGVFVFCFYIFTNVYIVIINWLIFKFSLGQGYKISSRLFSSYLAKDYLYFTVHNTAELSRVIFQDVARLTENVMIPFLMVISRTASAIAILVLLSFVNYKVTLMAAFLFGFCYLTIFTSIRGVLVKIGERFSFYNNQRFRTVSEAFGGIKDCKIYAAESYFISRYRESSCLDTKNHILKRTLTLIPRYLIDSLAIGALLIFSISLYVQGDTTVVVETLSVFAIAAFKLMPIMQQIFANLALIKSNKNALDLVLKDLEIEQTLSVELKENITDAICFKQSLNITDLSFNYPNVDSPVISKLNLVIKPNSITGIAGYSGSGKSTLIDILLGLLDYHEGSITIDGQWLGFKNTGQWQSILGYVPQSIYLVDASIAENIAFGIATEKIDYTKVNKVISDAQLDDLVMDLEDGIHTIVGEKGVRLSGGQIQRIGIARALYRNPEVLIFDEATSALDNITEKLIIETITRLSDKLTIIMVAHRLTTLERCDRIHIMENGAITVSGTYQELKMSNKYFQDA